MSIGAALKKVVAGDTLSAEEMSAAFGDIVDGKATDAQIAAFAVALRMRGEDPGEIAAAAGIMRSRAVRVTVRSSDYVDTCGTGGDGAGTFNVSTTAAFVVAATGLAVAKHGNRGISSKSGSADVLRELGVDVDAPVAAVEEAIASAGIGFLYAPLYHGALKSAANARREIGVRTFFNLLGPLANPAGAPYQVLGIYDGELLEAVAGALARLGTRGALVVHGSDGLDEVTLTGTTRMARVDARGNISLEELDPRELGLKTCAPDDLRGGEPQENAAITRAILAGEKSPRRDAVALNAAAALVAAGKADWKGALAAAQEAIDSGSAAQKLEALVKATGKKPAG
ncbi:MAG TPA: anthranilate phosphoribosyltransferase [bacterium]|nr:anthranilate phosphoribosyltransferase [bacterium]